MPKAASKKGVKGKTKGEKKAGGKPPAEPKAAKEGKGKGKSKDGKKKGGKTKGSKGKKKPLTKQEMEAAKMRAKKEEEERAQREAEELAIAQKKIAIELAERSGHLIQSGAIIETYDRWVLGKLARQRNLQEWKTTRACRNIPDFNKLCDVNSYISCWLSQLDPPAMKKLLKISPEYLQLLSELHDFLEIPPDSIRIDLLKELGIQYREMLNYQLIYLDKCTYAILSDLTELYEPEVGICDYLLSIPEIIHCLWGNIYCSPDINGHTFPEVKFKFKIPETLLTVQGIYRLVKTEYDHYSDSCLSYFAPDVENALKQSILDWVELYNMTTTDYYELPSPVELKKKKKKKKDKKKKKKKGGKSKKSKEKGEGKKGKRGKSKGKSASSTEGMTTTDAEDDESVAGESKSKKKKKGAKSKKKGKGSKPSSSRSATATEGEEEEEGDNAEEQMDPDGAEGGKPPKKASAKKGKSKGKSKSPKSKKKGKETEKEGEDGGGEEPEEGTDADVEASESTKIDTTTGTTTTGEETTTDTTKDETTTSTDSDQKKLSNATNDTKSETLPTTTSTESETGDRDQQPPEPASSETPETSLKKTKGGHDKKKGKGTNKSGKAEGKEDQEPEDPPQTEDDKTEKATPSGTGTTGPEAQTQSKEAAAAKDDDETNAEEGAKEDKKKKKSKKSKSKKKKKKSKSKKKKSKSKKKKKKSKSKKSKSKSTDGKKDDEVPKEEEQKPSSTDPTKATDTEKESTGKADAEKDKEGGGRKKSKKGKAGGQKDKRSSKTSGEDVPEDNAAQGEGEEQEEKASKEKVPEEKKVASKKKGSKKKGGKKDEVKSQAEGEPEKTDKPEKGKSEKGKSDKAEKGGGDKPEKGKGDKVEKGKSDKQEKGKTGKPEKGKGDKPEKAKSDKPEKGKSDKPEKAAKPEKPEKVAKGKEKAGGAKKEKKAASEKDRGRSKEKKDDKKGAGKSKSKSPGGKSKSPKGDKREGRSKTKDKKGKKGKSSSRSKSGGSKGKSKKKGKSKERNKKTEAELAKERERAEKAQFIPQLHENELNLRNYTILGGVYKFGMLEIPPQPKIRGNWTIHIKESDSSLKEVGFEADYVPPTPPKEDGAKMTPEEMEREAKRQEEELQKLVLADMESMAQDFDLPTDPEEAAMIAQKMRDEMERKLAEEAERTFAKLLTVEITAPRIALWFEPPIPVSWDPLKRAWSTEGFYDIKFNEGTLALSFRTVRFGTFAFGHNRWSNLPYQSWEMRPLGRDKMCFSLIAAIAVIEFIVMGDLICVSSLGNVTNSNEVEAALLNKYMKPRSLIKAMRYHGLDLFPELDSYAYVDGILVKHIDSEDHLYQSMALVSSSFNFQWSRWNLLAGREKMVYQMRERHWSENDPANYSMVLTTPRKTIRIDCTEVSPNYTEDPVLELEYYADLVNLVKAVGTDRGIQIINDTNPHHVEAVRVLLSSIRPLSFS